MKEADDGLSCVSFMAEITFNPSAHALVGYTRNDYEQFVLDNLEAYNVYGLDLNISAIGEHSMTFTVECMMYADDALAQFHNVYEGKTFRDVWESNDALHENVSVDIAISDVNFDTIA